MSAPPAPALLQRMARPRPNRTLDGVPPLLVVVWGALFLNVLTFLGVTVLPVPQALGQLVTQGALGVALLLALAANPRGITRPSLFLILMSMLALVSLMVSLHSEFLLGSTLRSLRLVGLVAGAWLLTAWFGRRDMLLLRCHRRLLWIVLATVVAGMLVAPGTAFSFQGRLSGVLWPILPTQVAHYAGVLLGTTVVLWMCRVISSRHALVTISVTAVLLVLTHTRTALLACVIGLVVAGGSLFLGHARVRRTSALSAILAVGVATAFAPQLRTWALRGQTTQEAGQLTGRTKVWSAVFDTPRPRIEEMFGSGMSNQSFNGLPIDSNWVASYLDQGWFGLAIQTTAILVLLLLAATRERGPQRAVALFLICYCVVASFTETGLGTASPYLLDMVVAASLLAPEPTRRGV